ncbi:STAS domain-containing protein [Hahella aquimaris]|uniref:STAS domain-containing protein n=1 Tax=Hahella sp. HNIBRBA332 TaxID=3015983 RepID=UPI00273CC0B0|nr:STAS domain-containing protein [Hahella sp. HNIBRBA332]WLQ16662.1 STAS domain-containing protein [Hahella sp. HNIBRBA332]
MNITEYSCNDYLVIALDGTFDANAVQHCRQQLEESALNHVGGVAFDLSDVSFMDSSGIGALVFIYKQLHANRRQMALVGLQGQPQRLATLLRIDRTILSFDTMKSFIALQHPVQEQRA